MSEMRPRLRRRPNIVLITADQWRGDCLGCEAAEHEARGLTPLGRHPVMTPHLNQLAGEGARYTQAYADCPVCMPQRVTTLTGMTASRFGLPNNFTARSPIDPATSLPGRLAREAGYQTKAIGKMHFHPDRARMGFEHVTLHPNDYVIWLEDTPYAGMYRGHGLGGNEVYPTVSAVPEPFTHTHWVIEQAIRFAVERDPECPFFLWLVFEAPHSPFDPPPPYDRMYDNFTIPAPAFGDWEHGDTCPVDLPGRRLGYKYDQLTDEMILEARRRYYGQVSHIDYQLGRFLGELKTKGLYDDTAFIFTADHGDHLGDHGLFSKTTYLSGSARVPLIVRVPGSVPMARPDQVVQTPTLTADIHATILGLAGLDPSADADGRSLLPGLAEARLDDARVVCGECANNTAFATDGVHKFIYWTNGGVEQLFDVRDDPDDLHDLAGDAALAEPKALLRAALVDYLSGFDRPLVADGDLVVREPTIDVHAQRGKNYAAWRGPMRYGQGYGG